MAAPIDQLPPFSDDGLVHAVVESPRGARVKYEYDPELGLFRIHRPLPVGLAYPFDWGFIPGTKADDGDPVDVLVMGDQVSYPGILIATHVIASLGVKESSEGKIVENPRMVAAPEWLDASICKARLDQCRGDIEAFLVRVGEAAGKKVVETRWHSAETARKYIDAHRR